MLLTTLIILDRRTLLREGIRSLLNRESDFYVQGDSAELDAVRLLCEDEETQMLLLDAAFLRGTEAEARSVIAQLRFWTKGASVLVIGRADDTASDEAREQERRSVLAAGASAWISPLLSRDEFVQALHRYLPGHGYSMHDANPQAVENLPDAEPAVKHIVTEREREILRLIAEGQCNKEIAHHLNISTQTVKNHVSHLLLKLALVDRTQLAVYFLEHHFEL